MRWSDSTTDSTDMSLSKVWETVEERGVWHATVHGLHRAGHNLVTEQDKTTCLKGSLNLVQLYNEYSDTTFKREKGEKNKF